jgi:hypothetical protein
VSVDPWPSAGVATTAQAVTAYGGAVLLRDVTTAAGPVEEVDATVGPKRRARGLSERQFVAAMAERSQMSENSFFHLVGGLPEHARGDRHVPALNPKHLSSLTDRRASPAPSFSPARSRRIRTGRACRPDLRRRDVMTL